MRFCHTIRVLFAVLLLTGSSWYRTTAAQTAITNSDSRLAVVSAFEPELEVLLAEADIREVSVIRGHSFHVGSLNGTPVVLFLSGVSMVNAAMYTQMAIDHFPVEAIVFSGIAGGVNPALNIGDVVVPERWEQYQEHIFAGKSGDTWVTGRSESEFGNFGMMFPRRLYLKGRGNKADVEERRFWFPADSAMVAAAGKIANAVNLLDTTKSGKRLAVRPRLIVGGNGVSGPTIVNNRGYRAWVWQTFQANALDMESAAIAHVAYINGIPLIVFRSLSDLTGGGPGANQMGTFLKLASRNSASVVLAFLDAWWNR